MEWQRLKNKRRLKRETLKISPHIELKPINLQPNPTSTNCQLVLTIYRLATGCSFSTLKDLFGVSVSSASLFCNKVCRVIIANIYDLQVTLLSTGEEWKVELKGFIENYEFPYVGSWDGFHVIVSSKVKDYYSFKRKYTVNSIGLVSHSKRLLYVAVGAPGSTHDACLLK